MTVIAFLAIFYVVLLVGLITLYFTDLIKSDIWLQGIILMAALTVFINMVPFVLYQTNIDNDFGLVGDDIVLNGMDLNNLDFFNSEFITTTDEFHQHRFDNIEDRLEREVVDADFCFFFNNTDAANVVQIVSVTDVVSENVYLLNNTFDFVCTDINVSLIKHSSLFGVSCADCSGANMLGIVSDNNSPTTAFHVEFDKVDPLNYVAEEIIPHVFWLELRYLPKVQVNDNFWRLLFFMGTFALIFIMRLIFVITQRGVDYR